MSTIGVLGLSTIIIGLVTLVLVFAMMWRVGAWFYRPAARLMEVEGLPVGGRAREVACYEGLSGTQEAHLAIRDHTTLLVFGTPGCRPCHELLRAAVTHPACRYWDLVYVAGTQDRHLDDLEELPSAVLDRWRVFRFHNEQLARDQWRAPVSPYFHLVDPSGRVLAKGLANSRGHLDRLLSVVPRELGRESRVAEGVS